MAIDLMAVNLPSVYKFKKRPARWHFEVIEQTPNKITFRVSWQAKLTLPAMPRYECVVFANDDDDFLDFKAISLLTGMKAESRYNKSNLEDTNFIIWWLKISLNFERENFLMSNGRLEE